MAKYRKKPVVVEAEQWFPGQEVHGVSLCPLDGQHYIAASEEWVHVTEGDWIITGISGEKYACKDSIFKETYELVEESEKGAP